MFTEISWRIGYVVLSRVGFVYFELLITFLGKSLQQDMSYSQNTHISTFLPSLPVHELQFMCHAMLHFTN